MTDKTCPLCGKTIHEFQSYCDECSQMINRKLYGLIEYISWAANISMEEANDRLFDYAEYHGFDFTTACDEKVNSLVSAVKTLELAMNNFGDRFMVTMLTDTAVFIPNATLFHQHFKDATCEVIPGIRCATERYSQTVKGITFYTEEFKE